MNPIEIHNTTEAMIRFGGGFVKTFATTVRVADSNNRTRLFQAFPELLEKYGPKSNFYSSVTSTEQ
jgi:hypothetical protein